jgi:hypothetical protein
MPTSFLAFEGAKERRGAVRGVFAARGYGCGSRSAGEAGKARPLCEPPALGFSRPPRGAGATATGAPDEVSRRVRSARGSTSGDHAGPARAGALERPTPRHVAMNWAARLKRVFAIDIEQCRGYGGRLRVIASIEDPALIERVLAHRKEKAEDESPRSGLGPLAAGRAGFSASRAGPTPSHPHTAASRTGYERRSERDSPSRTGRASDIRSVIRPIRIRTAIS